MKLKKSKREKEVSCVTEPVTQSRLYLGPDEPTLNLECWVDELSPIQLEAYKKADQEYNNIKNKLNSLVKESGGEVVYNGDQCTAYTISGKISGLDELTTNNTNYVPPIKVFNLGKKKNKKDKDKDKEKEREKEKEKEVKYVPPPSPPSPEPKLKETKKNLRSGKEKASKSISTTPATTNVQSVSNSVRPSEVSAIGGLATGSGSKNTIVDLTKEDSKNLPDSKEVAFNKLQGKTFPSLVVVARPYLRTKEGVGNTDRPALDSKVKSVLMHTPTKFTEWLIQQGLVRSEQTCSIHSANKLKLGMYSDVSKFPYSGGYVWISECCPARFVSVFFGSIFEGSVHPPSVILKLIYHWACQTNVQNVVQWVKVDNLYVKGLFTWLRAVCTAALHHHMALLGGNGKRIEVGVISLGTTSHDGLQRQVKVEVLGILDVEAKLVRLKAVEPLADGERNYKKRFQKILEPLVQWVNTDSVILTDLTVDKGTLLQMGFKSVHQVSNNDPPSKNSNGNIMEYLRRIVPRMFQNTLSLLSRQIIQQFLDELVWREWYGTSPGQAFDNIVLHIAEQTRLDVRDNLIIRLNKISSNPFKNWKYSGFKPLKTTVPQISPVVETPKESKRGRKRKEIYSPPPPSPPMRRGSNTKETRKRKSVNYIEPDDDDDVILMETRREKRLKKKEDEPYEKKKEIKKKPEKYKAEKVKIDKREKRREKEDLKICIKKEVNDQMVDLDTYYFGELKGDISKYTNKQMSVQCSECSVVFDNAINLQLHIFSHIIPNVQTDNETNIMRCKYCLYNTTEKDAFDDHLLEFHPLNVKSEKFNTYTCLICDVPFSSLSVLSTHMQRTHVQSELPYICGVCNYRVSCHGLCIDHFYNDHHNSASMQCPYCLKVIKVFADGYELHSNVQLYVEHLHKHQNKNSNVKCNRCALKFVHSGTLKEHQVKNHITVKGIMTLGNENSFLINKPKNKATPPVKDSGNHIFIDTFDNVNLLISDGFICKECDTHLEDDRHFLGTVKCTKCTYQTNCWKSLLQHSSVCQHNKLKGQKPFMLPSNMHCICSFSTNNGNALVEHLVQCEKQSAYPSEDLAKSNTIMVSPYKQAVMDSLCLQRNKDVDYNAQINSQNDNVNDYSAPPSVLNTQLSLDDLAPPSVLQPDHQMELDQLKNEAYEQPLATPQVQHEELDAPESEIQQNTQHEQIHRVPIVNQEPLFNTQTLDSYMDSAGEFEPLPSEPMSQSEFEPL